MNAGKNYEKARAQAQANANYSGLPRYLYFSGGVWQIEKTQLIDTVQFSGIEDTVEVFQPKTAKGANDAE